MTSPLRNVCGRLGAWGAGVLLVALLASSASAKKPKPPKPEPDAGGFASGFIDIDLSEEEAALDAAAMEEYQSTTAECGDLQALETNAMMGQLSDAQIRCLEESLKEAGRQTVKDKINRVLLNDAWSKRDEHRWEAIAMRHVTEINRSDPDMCYRLAFYLVDRGPDRMDEAIKWADTALENRSYWEGDTYVKRVYSLYKFRTQAAEKKWRAAEEEFARAPADDLSEKAKKFRDEYKTMAREWLDYAREAGKDLTLPLQHCSSAAGTSDFCKVD
jgi:hypothetical protein